MSHTKKITHSHISPPILGGVRGGKSGFTLVELIVTITIIAILWVIAFTAFKGFESSARDSTRSSDLANLSQWLDTSYIKTGSYPNPDNAFTVTYSGWSLWYQWTVWDTLINTLSSNGSKLSKKPTDPLNTTREYTYSKSAYGNTYELSSNWEWDSLAYTHLISQAFAASGNPLITYIKGNYNGMVAKTITGSTIYVIATPSITTSTGTAWSNIDVTTLSGKLLYHGQTNSGWIAYTPTLVYSGVTLPINDDTWKITLLTNNLQTAYSGSVVSSNSNISNVLTTTWATNITSLWASIITNYLGWSASAPPPPPVTGYSLSNSLMFDSAGSQYLSKTLWVNGRTGKILTMSFWAKRGKLGSEQYIFGVDSGVAWYSTFLEFTATDQLRLYTNYGLSTTRYGWYTTRVFRDPSAWIHFSIAIDTSQSGQGSRRLWINGIEETSFTAEVNGYNTTSMSTYLLGNYSHFLGSATNGFDGYLANVNFVDSGALDPTAFGYTDPTTNQWLPKAYTGAYGTNGFHLDFSSGATTLNNNVWLGKDSSGNGNYWNTNGFSDPTANQIIDTPSNNFATLNPLDSTISSCSTGNLKSSFTASYYVGGGAWSFATPLTGKWYFEVKPTVINTMVVGVIGSNVSGSSNNLGNTWRGYWSDGQKVVGWVFSWYGQPYVANDTIWVAIDLDNAIYTFYKNGVSQGDITWTSINNWKPAISGSGVSANTAIFNFWQWWQADLTYYPDAWGKFKFQPPTGFKALSTANLPDPTIKNPKQYFDVLTYTGNASNQTIGTLSFQPDFVWIKARNFARWHHLYDSVRGPSHRLESNSSVAEDAVDPLGSFNPNGFSVTAASPNTNTNNETYVAWNWKAWWTAVANNNGTIASQVSANPTAGFSIVTYTGTQANATVGHGLGVAPKMIIVKNRDDSTRPWAIYHAGVHATLPANYRLSFDTGAIVDDNTVWNYTKPVTDVFSLGVATWTNKLNLRHIAYCFTDVPGYSKFGSYTGNGSSDGPFVYTGFRPRYVMIKRTDVAGGDWYIQDTSSNPYNLSMKTLRPNLPDIEATYDLIDIVSNGFKLRNTYNSHNVSGSNYIYAAFAEAPFKYANAR